MKTKIILILLFFSCISFGQTKSSFDFIAGYEYSYRHLKMPEGSTSGHVLLELRKGEIGKINYRIGFNYNRSVSDQFWLKTGLRFFNSGYRDVTNNRHIWATCGMGLNNIAIDPENIPKPRQVRYNFLFLELPIIGRYEFGNGKISPFAEIGISSNIYLGTNTKTITSAGTSVDYYYEWLHLINFSGNLSIGLKMRYSEHLSFFFQPIMRYHFTNRAYVSNDLKENLYNYGVELGFRKTLK